MTLSKLARVGIESDGEYKLARSKGLAVRDNKIDIFKAKKAKNSQSFSAFRVEVDLRMDIGFE